MVSTLPTFVPCIALMSSVWPTDANGNSSAMLFGPTPDNNVGADEDDFHTFKRRTAHIEMEEKKLERVRQTIVAKAGAHSGVVQALGKPPVASKKIVYF
jgi:zinc finger CCHC domain-containing protein 9